MSSIKKIVQEIYNKNRNYNEPEQAINQAESLKSLSNDLYTDTKRFIYELLQNADDSSCDGNNVDVCIKLHDDFLIIAHTGKQFTSKDVRGLCNINNGTKKCDISKTGFKGIGFKSVFGQSNKVTVYSDNEYFKFDSNYDFEWKKNWIEEGYESQKKWEEKNEREFSYPWQIIPIYITREDAKKELDSEIINFLSTRNWNVATILKVAKQDEIIKAIEELLSNVNMFLFLKNINSIKFELGTTTTIISIDKNYNESVLKKDTEIVSKWITNTVSLLVNSELKDLLQNDSNIPKKLKEAGSIELTLAIKKNEQGLEKLSQNENLLYAYLPTDEKKYSLPILVNSTFLTSANRESLHSNSKWNQWLFKSISIELFKWIALLVKEEYSYQAYDLMPNKLKFYDDLSNAYNDGINEAIKTIPFILSKENELLKVKEALIDETSLSNKVFIGTEIIRDFMQYKIGDGNKIVKKPFVPSNLQLKKIGVADFSWSDIPAFFAFEDFVSEHTVEKNIQLIEYFKNESEINKSLFPKEKLKNWAFLYDHNNKLNYLNNIYFPTSNDTTWNNSENELLFVHKDIQDALINKQPVRAWLEQLGVIEKTDMSFLVKTIIPKASTYVSNNNAIETIQTIYNLYKKENIDCYLKQLNKLSLLIVNEELIPASEVYFTDSYEPRVKLETVLDGGKFLSEKYLLLDDDKDEIRRFFKLIGVKEEVQLITFYGKQSSSFLIENSFCDSYFTHYSNNTYNMKMHTYSNMITFSFLADIICNKDFASIFWNNVINSIDCKKVSSMTLAEWGHFGSTEYVENYLKWYIKNNKCIPTTQDTCEKSQNIFLNTDEIKSIGDKYLPIFDGIELNQEWKSFFQFKTKLVLDDYLELLTNIMIDKNDDGKIKNNNKTRVQFILKALLNISTNWGTDEIEKLKLWASSSFLVDEEDNIILCSELKYYVDGDNSIFQNIHRFIALNEENRIHTNLITFLEYLGIDILRQDSFSIEIIGERVNSDLKYKLENISPFLIKWIEKTDDSFDSTSLKDRLNILQIDEVSKLSLSYDETILKSVKNHIENDNLLVVTPWNSNISMLELPKVLCDYFKIKGYENKLAFLLNTDNELEIREYFENENIELPITSIVNKTEEIFSKEEIISTLNTTEKEYEDLKNISNDFYHTSESSLDKLEYIQSLLTRSKKRILEHLSTLDEYDCSNVDDSASTVLSGIKKFGNEIYIIPRPSDNGKVIIYFPSELDTLEYTDSELWYENGISIPKKLTFGKVLRDTKINKIPIKETNQEKVFDIIQNEEVILEPILPSSLQIAKILASLANTNGGYLIIGYSKEKEAIGIHSDFNTTQLIQDAIKYSDSFEGLLFEDIVINGKTILVVKIEKSNTGVLIENIKYIRMGSIIKEEQENNNKPLVITEGKTDKAILEVAWKKLYDREISFEIQSSGVEIEEEKREGSADSVKRTIELMSGTFDKDRVLVGLFDNDREGNNNFKGLTKKAFEKYNISLKQRKHLSKNIYALLLPVPKFRSIFVSDNDIGQRMFVIEHYFNNEILEKHQMKGKSLFGSEVFKVNNGKANFARDIEKLDKKEFEDFKLIFDAIEDIIDDSRKD